jgi:FkbM family methyltransferase
MSKLSFLGKLIRLPLKLIPKNFHIRILYGPLKGAKWITDSSNHGYWIGTYEPRMKRLLSEHLKDGNVFFDLGGHVGYYTLLASRLVGKSGKVITFEPLPRNLSFLKEHLQINSVENVSLFEGAVAHFDGIFKLQDSSRVGAKLSDKGKIDVKVFSLKKLWDEKRVPIADVIKMDIEGAELELIQSISNYLSSFPISIFLSTHGRETHQKCLQILSALNYKFVPLDASGIEECTELYCYKPQAKSHG